jgi:putative phosphoribosyl transferase
MGAIASGGIRVLNPRIIQGLGLSPDAIDRVVEEELAEIERRETIYRGAKPPIDPRGKVAILVDDGLATGATMRAAVEALRKRVPRKIVVGVPIGFRPACEDFEDLVDETSSRPNRS